MREGLQRTQNKDWLVAVTDDPNHPPTQEQVLTELRRVHIPQASVTVTATHAAGLFDDDTPAEVVDDLERELEVGPDGWGLHVEREWRLELVPGVKVVVAAGADPARVLEQLDRIRAELAANPGMLSADWRKPLQKRPALRVVKG